MRLPTEDEVATTCWIAIVVCLTTMIVVGTVLALASIVVRIWS
jgi:hypothetical protein